MDKKVLVCLSLFFSTRQAFAQKDSLYADSLSWLETVLVNTLQNNGHTIRGKFGNQNRTERILEQVPGVDVISRGNFAQQPVIHGMGVNRVNMTIGGMRVFGACTDNMDPISSYIEPTNLQTVSIQKNPGFGGGATIGGNIDFTLHQTAFSDSRIWQAAIGSAYETNDQSRQFLGKMNFSNAKWAFSFDGIFRRANDYTPGGNKQKNIAHFEDWTFEKGFAIDSKGRMRFSQFQKWNLHTNLGYKLNEKNTFRIDYLQDEGHNIGYPALTMDVAFAISKMASLSHLYLNPLHKLNSVETKLYFNDIRHAMDDTKRPSAQVSMHMDMPGHSQTFGWFTQLQWKPLESHFIRMKGEAYVNRWHADMTMYPKDGSGSMYMLTIPDVQMFSTGWDVADRIVFNSKFSIEPGLRLQANHYSLYSSLGRQTVTSLGSASPVRTDYLYNAYIKGQYLINPKWHLQWDLARAMRSPDSKELYSFYLFDRQQNYDFWGNMTLKRECSWNTSVTINYQRSHFSITGNAFAYFLQNYIAGVVQPGASPMTSNAFGVKKYENIGNAHIVGASLLFHWNILTSLQLYSNNTWQMGKDALGHYLAFMPPFHSRTGVNYEWHGFEIFSNTVLAARQSHISSFYGEKVTPSFFILNAGMNKNVRLGRTQLQLGITGNNLFNKYYYEHLDFIKLPRMGRNYILQITYSL